MRKLLLLFIFLSLIGCEKLESNSYVQKLSLKSEYKLVYYGGNFKDEVIYARSDNEAFNEAYKRLASKMMTDKILEENGIKVESKAPTSISLYKNGNVVYINEKEEKSIKDKWQRIAKVKFEESY